MDGSRFDALTKSLAHSGSRRRVLAGLLGGALGAVGLERADTAACRPYGGVCREHANCCSKVCGPKDRTGRQACACQVPADCPVAGSTCRGGVCVAPTTTTAPPTTTTTTTSTTTTADPQGTCATGDDHCAQQANIFCNGTDECICLPTTTGATFCAGPLQLCNACATDAECTAVTGPGSRCVTYSDACGGCPTTNHVGCAAPCPTSSGGGATANALTDDGSPIRKD